MARHWKFLWMLPLILAVACGDEYSGSPDNPPPAVTPDWRDILRDSGEPLQHRIEAAFQGIEQDQCFRKAEDVTACDWNRYNATPEHVEPAFLAREAILVSDVLRPAVEMLRYRNRVLGFYEVLDDGSIASVPLQWDLPEVFGDILTAFATSPAVPSDALGELQSRLHAVYGKHVPALGTHGLAVFNILADMVPGNPVVFLDIHRLPFHQSIPATVCAIETVDDEAGLQRLREHAAHFAGQLKGLLATHNIRFVNASWGYTIETVRGPWENTCGSEPPPDEVLLAILETYRPVFDALFNSKGVFTAHAAQASPIDAHHPFDQPDARFPNRLRVGVFEHPGTAVPAEGMSEVPAQWRPSPGSGDADVWVNTGCGNETGCRPNGTLRLTLQYGMGRTDFPLAQTSFITPVLLATFLHSRNRMPDASMDNALVSSIIGQLAGGCGTAGCRYIDPLQHGNIDGN